jgi:hypothetical protein
VRRDIDMRGGESALADLDLVFEVAAVHHREGAVVIIDDSVLPHVDGLVLVAVAEEERGLVGATGVVRQQFLDPEGEVSVRAKKIVLGRVK